MQLSLLYRVSEEYEGMWGGGIWMIDMCDGKLKLYSGVIGRLVSVNQKVMLLFDFSQPEMWKGKKPEA